MPMHRDLRRRSLLTFLLALAGMSSGGAGCLPNAESIGDESHEVGGGAEIDQLAALGDRL